jgi:hypothetical protein
MKAAAESDSDPHVVKGADGKAVRGLIGFGDGTLADQGIDIAGLVGQLTNLVHRAWSKSRCLGK